MTAVLQVPPYSDAHGGAAGNSCLQPCCVAWQKLQVVTPLHTSTLLT
jgi:hypothetical protein